MKTINGYVFFWGKNDLFSNFYESSFTYKGVKVHSSEQAFMLEKAWTFNDDEMAEQIKQAESPGQAKALGRQVSNYDDALWSSIRYAKMLEVLRAKVRSSYFIQQHLMLTGDKVLAEASPYDKIWGIGLKEDNPQALQQHLWKGQNLLGKAWMELRDEAFEQIAKHDD